ncbi:MAG TPA: 16S rRNA (uracil(1498)-N(3))-methyltransferase [Verrucomicrobiales bacterium]|nr:16S rRNA (uracil(1498)-N(3))-methyltransferase [Verrucomicrobiales bacterium]HIL71869.1 16S rRNA (uracil(1498)-N(3))-methyltransferase [Verrucomicrobiota bacterium]
MHRFFLSPASCLNKEMTLGSRESRHAVKVLRIKTGERIVVLDGTGTEYLCQVRTADPDATALSLIQKNSIAPLPYQITLAHALTKGKTIDWVIQKATELGVHRIVPLISERSVVRWDAESADAKLSKWKTTAIEAIKQCGSAWLPSIDPPLQPKEFLENTYRFELTLIASLQEDSLHPQNYFDRFREEHGRLPESICVWVGPEGDFTPAEIHSAKTKNAHPISLGKLVLRSETASIYCLSVLNYQMQA